MAKLTAEQIASVKGRGFLRNRGTDCFSGRIVPRGCVFSADELAAVAELSRRYGNGRVAFTSRLNAEVAGIPFERIAEAEGFAAENGLAFGGTGAKIRPVTACKGTTCVFGNFDTQALARRIHDVFYIGWKDVSLPHKFKIGIGGCPNSCMKPSLNDFGVEGHRLPAVNPDACRGCGTCAVEKACPVNAASLESGKITLSDSCITCGVCASRCPFGAVPEEAVRFRIFVGGTWGKTTRMGTPLSRLVTAEEVLPLLEKPLLWYRENGYTKERLGKTVDRLGVEALETALFTDELLDRREAILAAPLKVAP